MQRIFKLLVAITFLVVGLSAQSQQYQTYQQDGDYQDQTDNGYQEQQPQYDTDTNQYGGLKPDLVCKMPQPQSPEGKQATWQQAWDGTNGACDLNKNPHTYACNEWNFNGNDTFPVMPMNWDALQGEWFTVTYVNSKSNKGPQFEMKKNPRNPKQPMGVYNVDSNSPIGSMWIEGNTIRFENWRGEELTSDQFKWVDQNTIQFGMSEGSVQHSFNCRDFNRNDNHHLLCDWWVKSSPNQKWQKHGYFGFLLKNVWDCFIMMGKMKHN